ncbi:RNA-binding cell elongation regulator Jag/EloR [Erysipelotrichaceae bacterium HCN-30851]
MKTYTGKNLDEVLNQAAEEKGVSVSELTYKVIEESSGFLGIGSKVTITAYCKNDISEFMKEYLQNYFDGIHMEAEIQIEMDGEYFHINLNTENNAILIGKNGQTLQAMNTVLKSAVSSEFKRRVGVLIDINGYKEEKYQKVCSLAQRVAKTVQRTKTTAVLDPMPADERKAIHNCLSNMKYISTVSEGEGNQRRLKIVYNEEKI